MAIQSSRRRFIAGSTAAGAMLAMPGQAAADSFPDKSSTIRAIIPFSTGGTVDVWGRPYAQAMTEVLGNNVIVDNRAGADGVIGLQAVRSAPADGYTLLFTSLSTQVVSPHLYKKLPYDPIKDFIPLAGTLRAPLLAFVGSSVTFKTAAEFLASAKANPGKYTFGSISATTRIAGEMLGKAAGVKLLNIPYKNFGDLMSNLVSGRIDLYMSDIASVLPFLSQGVRPIGAAALQRVTAAPDVPTLAEQGLPGFEVVGWHAAYAPAGTPAPVIEILRGALQKSARSKYVTDALTTARAEPFDLAGDALIAFQTAEYERWGQAIREAGLAGTL